MTAAEIYSSSIYPSEPAGKIGLMVMRTIRELPAADLLTMKVFKSYLEAAEKWNGSSESRRSIQNRARDINLLVVFIFSVYFGVGSFAHHVGFELTDSLLYSTAAWIQICLFAKNLD